MEPVRRYLELKADVKRRTEEMKALEPEIWDAVDTEGGKADAFGCHLETKIKRTYLYSEDVQELAARLSTMKAAERASGIATIDKATGYVRVTMNAAASTAPDGTPHIDLDALATEAAMTEDERHPVGTPF